jgi:hypothetical protein
LQYAGQVVCTSPAQPNSSTASLHSGGSGPHAHVGIASAVVPCVVDCDGSVVFVVVVVVVVDDVVVVVAAVAVVVDDTVVIVVIIDVVVVVAWLVAVGALGGAVDGGCVGDDDENDGIDGSSVDDTDVVLE